MFGNGIWCNMLNAAEGSRKMIKQQIFTCGIMKVIDVDKSSFSIVIGAGVRTIRGMEMLGVKEVDIEAVGN